MTIPVLMNWSGGKDSALALHRILHDPRYAVAALLTTVSEPEQRISMHGVRVVLLEAQAHALGLPLIKVPLPEHAPMPEYDERMRQVLCEVKAHGVEHAVFGDIFLEDLRSYREERLAEVGMTALFPLWYEDTKALAAEFLERGFSAVTVCVNERYLDRTFVGRRMDRTFFADLPPSVDPCGENGEYHSFVYAGPLFTRVIEVERGEVTYRRFPANDRSTDQTDEGAAWDTGFWYQDLRPVSRVVS